MQFQITRFDKAIMLLVFVFSFYLSKSAIGYFNPEAARNLCYVVPGMLIAYPAAIMLALIGTCFAAFALFMGVGFIWGADTTDWLLLVAFPFYAHCLTGC